MDYYGQRLPDLKVEPPLLVEGNNSFDDPDLNVEPPNVFVEVMLLEFVVDPVLKLLFGGEIVIVLVRVA